jgi:hypothetical protein
MVYVFLLRFQALCAESEVEEISLELADSCVIWLVNNPGGATALWREGTQR